MSSPPLKTKELLETMICNTNNRDCMLHSCDQCPRTVALKEKLESIFDEYEKEQIKFKQWKRDENKTNLLSCELSIEKVTSHFDTLQVHHFITKSQGNFLKDFKKKKKLK